MLRRQVQRIAKSQDVILPAPIGGLNARDSLADMGAQYAIVMDNYIPSENKVELRQGYTRFIKMGDSLTGVKTLFSYRKAGATRLFAIYEGKIYNISSPNSPKLYNVTFTNSYCQAVQYKNYAYFMNGADKPKVFYIGDDDVEHFEDWGFTSDSSSFIPNRIINGAVSKEFLWFVERGSLRAWYAAEAGNIAGSLKSFDLSQVAKWGGELVAVADWTIDGGQGIDDMTVFLTSEGEALIYKGSNPNSATDWELVGSYKLSKPIGYKCLLQYQGDIVIISQDGYIPLSKSLANVNTGSSAYAFSDLIRGLVLDRTRNNADKEGWQGIIYTKRGYGIFNVPVAQQYEQHVINVNTGAWCRFTGIRARCWAEYNGDLYFGADDGVYHFDDGYSDDGVQIEGHVEQAYTNLGTDKLKKIPLLNPKTRSSTNYQLIIYTNMDFEDRNVGYYANIGSVGVTKWNVAKWSSSANPIGTKWSTLKTTKIRSQWIANSATGFKCSVVFKTKTKGNKIEWFETNVRYEIGNGII